jgi:ketosteroid isomerase-like protein
VSQANVDVVRRVFEAFNSEDIERILAFTHPSFQAEISAELSPEPDVYLGRAGMRRYFQSFQDAMDEIRFQLERFWDLGQTVVVALRLTAKGRQTGIPVEQRSAGVWTIEDGKVIQVRAYASVSEALAAARRTATER